MTNIYDTLELDPIINDIKKSSSDNELLTKIKNNNFTDEELFNLIHQEERLTFFLKHNYFRAINYITESNLLLTKINDNKNIIELFFKDTIKDRIKLRKINKIISQNIKSPTELKLETLFNTLLERKIITHDDLFETILNSNSKYNNAYIKSIISIMKYNYLLDEKVDITQLKEVLMKKDNSTNSTILANIIRSELDFKINMGLFFDDIDIAKEYFNMGSPYCYGVLLRFFKDDILKEDILGENKNILDYYLTVFEQNLLEKDKLLNFVPSNQNILLEKSTDGDNYFDKIIKILVDNNSFFRIHKIGFKPNLLLYKSKYLNGKSILAIYEKKGLLNSIINTNLDNLGFWLYELEPNKTMLEYLLDINFSDTYFRIKNNKTLMSSVNIVLLLNKKNDELGIKDKVKFKPPSMPFIRKSAIEDEFKKLYYEKYYDGEITKEAEEKINYFRELMLQDGKSSIEIIDLACNAFKSLYVNGFPYADRDLDSTINLKTNNSSFYMVYDPTEKFSYYSPQEKTIVLKNKYDINTFNHELTHALHHAIIKHNIDYMPLPMLKYIILSFFTYNEKKAEAIERILKKHKERTKENNPEIRKFLTNKMHFEDLPYFKNQINAAIQKARESNEYSDELLDFLSSKMIDLPDFYDTYYNSVKRSLKSVLRDIDASVEDILDANYKGYLMSNGFTTKVGKKYTISGHGEDYYRGNKDTLKRKITIRFKEILADYVAIIKNPDKDKVNEAIDDLRSVFGNEFIDLVDNYYKNLTITPKISNLSKNGGKRK